MRKKQYLFLPTILAIGILTGCGGNTTLSGVEETISTVAENVEANTEQEAENLIEQALDSMDAAELLTEWKTTQYFTDDPVAENDIEQILAAGVMNSTPEGGSLFPSGETSFCLKKRESGL